MHTFTEFWKSNKSDDIRFKWSVTVRVYSRATDTRKEIRDSGEVFASSQYEATNKVTRMLSNKYDNGIYSNFMITRA